VDLFVFIVGLSGSLRVTKLNSTAVFTAYRVARSHSNLNAKNCRASSWFRTEAGRGYSPAADNLGALYRFGQVSQKTMWRQSAGSVCPPSKGTPLRSITWGEMYLFGSGVPQSDAMAFAWLKRARGWGSRDAAEYIREIEQVIAGGQVE